MPWLRLIYATFTARENATRERRLEARWEFRFATLQAVLCSQMPLQLILSCKALPMIFAGFHGAKVLPLRMLLLRVVSQVPR
jgi:hypothetical protein